MGGISEIPLLGSHNSDKFNSLSFRRNVCGPCTQPLPVIQKTNENDQILKNQTTSQGGEFNVIPGLGREGTHTPYLYPPCDYLTVNQTQAI